MSKSTLTRPGPRTARRPVPKPRIRHGDEGQRVKSRHPAAGIALLLNRGLHLVGTLEPGIQSRARGGHTERRTAVEAPELVDLPAAQDLLAGAAVRESLALSEGKIEDAADMQHVGAIVVRHHAVHVEVWERLDKVRSTIRVEIE
jgi:hypothetical protein